MPDLWKYLILDPMLNGLLLLYQLLFHNLALAIIVFTVLIRALTFPLTYQQQKASKKMAEFQQSDAWKRMQTKYADDKQKLQQEQMKLMQEAGVNPLDECLPLVIQMPVLIGLYQALSLVMAASPLQLFELSRYVYPFFDVANLLPLNNSFLGFNLGLPDSSLIITVLVVATTWIQSKVMTPPPTTDPNAAQMTQSMALTSTLMIGMFSLSVPSGLALYWIVGNVLGVVQQSFTSKIEWRNIFSLGLPAPAEPEKPTKKKRRAE